MMNDFINLLMNMDTYLQFCNEKIILAIIY